MVYLLYGTNDFAIQKEIEKITKDFDKMNISKHDLTEDDIKDVISDAETFSMFADNKVVIAENATIFTSSGNGDLEILENYLADINPNTILIFTINEEKIDERKKITKKIKKDYKLISFNQNETPNSLVRNLLNGYNITSSNINLLIDRVGTNPLILENEVNKIKLYKDDKTVTKEDILNLTTKRPEIDIFKLIDDIVMKNKDEALEIYNEMLKVNEEPLKIVILLASQFRLMYQAKELAKKGYSEKNISEVLKVHPYRVKLALQKGKKYKAETLLNYLNALADIDIAIKTGKTDKNLALELFLLNE
ncbi:MAG TPA: DNA polymerase III subunit delta [Candidatus Coprosoma intestinipullorum]|uniref:DNA polymerase III subunit delta n=1 Tax=Candidatus Coprosoma intestinipullorum TaxID=2840752 RepID=A0A9D0ZU05_9FIRM|nr:DNA polymerase III subunit delta [Candidatus Coprosoma intestinipullorum]